MTKPGKLILAARPIGNYKDASLRLIEALGSVDLIAAEDTRKLKRLLNDLEIKSLAKIISFFEENEISKIDPILKAVTQGQNVLIISDAGTVTISDPGFKLVQRAIEANVKIEVLPGASAPIAALTLSGFATDEFTFVGFLPRKKSLRREKMIEIENSNKTVIFFESPRRILDTLKELVEIFEPDRNLVIARELTKTYEEIARGNLRDLITWAQKGVLGEVTVVVEGRKIKRTLTADQAKAATFELMASGLSHKDAVSQVAATSGLAKRELYQATLDLSHE